MERYYKLLIGRFMQEDRYRGDGLNLYAYCDNNFINYVDPTGYATPQCQLKEELYQRQKLRKEAKLKESNYKNGNKPEKGTRGTDKSTWKEQDRKRRLENKGYYQDTNDRWLRPNGQYASNREVGISKPKPQKTVKG